MAAAPSHAQQEYCKTSRGNVGNGYHYEMWIQDGTPGNACLTVSGEKARFKTTWNLQGYGFVARVGLLFDQTRTDEQIGWITSDFEHSLEGQGHAWVGIYGWTVDPLIEYYILEDWIGWKPQYTRKGTIQVDGGEYEVFTNTRVQQPSIKGTQTFEQWYSVRTSQRRSGRISVSEHFAQWRVLGMRTGKLYEAKLKVEGLNGSGSVEFTKATVEIGLKDAIAVRPGEMATGGRTPKQGGILYTPKGSRVGPVVDGKGGTTPHHGRLPAGIYLLSPNGP
jgi:endo-1,4-beta-xylanase